MILGVGRFVSCMLFPIFYIDEWHPIQDHFKLIRLKNAQIMIGYDFSQSLLNFTHRSLDHFHCHHLDTKLICHYHVSTYMNLFLSVTRRDAPSSTNSIYSTVCPVSLFITKYVSSSSSIFSCCKMKFQFL